MIIDGKKIAQNILSDLSKKAQDFEKRAGYKPVLCDVLVGDDPVSLSYVNIKERTAHKYGFGFKKVLRPENVSLSELVSAIKILESEQEICGIIVQLPLPEKIDTQEVLDSISPSLDVDCLGIKSKELLQNGKAIFLPPTAGAIIKILDSLKIDLSDRKILIVGEGKLVGQPTMQLLKQRGLNPASVNKNSKNIRQQISSADVIISGVGQPGLITGNMIKNGVVVIDAGTAESGGGIKGDVETESVLEVASFLAPVPGGVGPMTVAVLLENVYKSAEQKLSKI